MKYLLLALTLAVGAASPALSQQMRGSADDPVIDFSSSDAEMNAAIDAARGTLDRFFAQTVEADGVSIDNAYLKVGVPADDGSGITEHVWVGPFKKVGYEYAGILSSTPVHFSHTAPGEVLSFTHGMISDWGYVGVDGVYFGYYTARVATRRLPADQAAEYADLFSPEPIPPGW